MIKKQQQHIFYFMLGLSLFITNYVVMAAAPPTQPTVKENYIEAGIGHHQLTSGYQDWDIYYLKGGWQQNESNIWDWTIEHQDRFGGSGLYFLAGLTHIFNDDWFGSISFGTSKSGFFLPRQRIDAFINRKLLPDKNLVLTFGAGYIDEKNVHTTNSLYLGATYYFESPWVIAGGIRWNISSPGSVSSTRQIVALSWIHEKDRHITFNLDWGNEAYQFIDATVSLVDFSSNIASITWREWLQQDWGSNVVVERYDNPFYQRNGITVGIFKEF